jgi:hypothetical protein
MRFAADSKELRRNTVYEEQRLACSRIADVKADCGRQLGGAHGGLGHAVGTPFKQSRSDFSQGEGGEGEKVEKTRLG